MSNPFRRKANHLRIAIAAVTSGVLLMGGAASNYVYAQPAADPSADVEEIVVIGSRIRRSTTIENIVVTEVTAEQMDSRAFVNTIESLEQLPFVSVGVNNQGNSTQFGDNNAYVNLLNLGSQRTVTLVDGRRMVSSNQGTVFVPGNATGAQVDLSIINPSLIERTEVQTIGSGAVYGPDAIAGVVNVQLDRDFEGLEVITQLGTTAESDGDQRRLSMAWGSEALDGRAHVVLGAEYLEAEPVYYGSGRPWTNNISTINNPYSLSGTDGVANTVFQDEMIGVASPLGGRLDMRQINSGNSATFYFPRACIAAQTVNVAGCNAFTAQRGQSPWANGLVGGLNPMAFVGTFGLTSGFPTVPVQAGSADAFAGLTRVAIPLTFNSAGNPVPLALGNILPPDIASQSVAINAGGFDSRDLNTIQAGQDR
jgi:outer membrane receptor protein involved in Fe transport